MTQKKIKVHASFSKEYMYEQGIKNGLSKKAADFFKYFNEKKLVLTVNSETGEVIKAQATN